MKRYNQKACIQTVLFIGDCFFTTFTLQIVHAIVQDVINVDIQRKTK